MKKEEPTKITKGKKRFWRAQDYVTYFINLEEIKEMKIEFDAFDSNRAGIINPKEIIAAIESLGIGQDTYLYKWSIKDLEQRQEGIDFQQFINMLCPKISDKMLKKQTDKIFTAFCQKQRRQPYQFHRITYKDFVETAMIYSLQEDKQYLEYQFNRADMDEDGFITSSDFYNMLTHKYYWEL